MKRDAIKDGAQKREIQVEKIKRQSERETDRPGTLWKLETA
jgi:hypothetical protein